MTLDSIIRPDAQDPARDADPACDLLDDLELGPRVAEWLARHA